MIARIDTPGVPDRPVGFEGALRIRRIGREPIPDMPLDLGNRTQSTLGARPKRLWRHDGTGRHRIASETMRTRSGPGD
jgi:hypothetical protein